MPVGLVNVLTRDEIVDLHAYVEAGGYHLPEGLGHGGHGGHGESGHAEGGKKKPAEAGKEKPAKEGGSGSKGRGAGKAKDGKDKVKSSDR
jgi:hypothetical protein